MVEPASTFLMSSLAQPIQAPKSSVTVPTTTTAVLAAEDSAKIAWLRVIRYTPAVTMVAAWIRADTGVGPSMASGSQVWRKNWADLPIAPMNSRKQAISISGNTWPAKVQVFPAWSATWANTSWKLIVPNAQ